MAVVVCREGSYITSHVFDSICWSFRVVRKLVLILAWAESSMRETG